MHLPTFHIIAKKNDRGGGISHDPLPTVFWRGGEGERGRGESGRGRVGEGRVGEGRGGE